MYFFFSFFLLCTKDENHLRGFCVSSLQFLNLDNIVKQPNTFHAHVPLSYPLTRNIHALPIQLSFLLWPAILLSFKTLHRNISLRSGSRTTLFVFRNHDDGYHDAWPSSKDDENALRARKSTRLSPPREPKRFLEQRVVPRY